MSQMRLTGVAALVATMLAGCSLAPTYHVPETAVPTAYKEVGVWQPATPADTQARGDWWQHYSDPELGTLVAQLDAANPSLAAAAAHYDRALAFEQEARASLFPTLNAGAYDTQNKMYYNKPHLSVPTDGNATPQNYRDEYAGIGMAYEVDLWGRVHNAIAAGHAQSEAAAADLESVRLSLRASLVSNYIALRGLDAQKSLLEDVVVAYGKALTLTQNRFKGGIDSALNVSRAQAQVDIAKGQLQDIEASRALYEHAIASLVGTPASSFKLAPAPFVMTLPQIPLGVPADILQRRPDIASAERQVAAANAEIGVARAAYYPTVMLGGLTGFESVAAENFMLAPVRVWSIGPQALMTLFDGGRRDAVTRQAEDTRDIAAAEYRATVLHAFQEVEDNLALLNQLATEAQSIDAAVRETNKTLDIAMNRYREGMVSYLEVVTAQTAALQVDLQSLNLRTRRLQANVNLVRALGGGYVATRQAATEAHTGVTQTPQAQGS